MEGGSLKSLKDRLARARTLAEGGTTPANAERDAEPEQKPAPPAVGPNPEDELTRLRAALSESNDALRLASDEISTLRASQQALVLLRNDAVGRRGTNLFVERDPRPVRSHGPGPWRVDGQLARHRD